MKYDPRYIEIDEEVRKIIREAHELYGSYHAFGRALNMTSTPAKKLVIGEAKHINKEKFLKLKAVLEHIAGEPT